MFYKVSFCKVCQSKNNKVLIKLPFKDKKIISFFKKFYKRNKINEIKNLTKNSYYELLKNVIAALLYGKNIIQEQRFRINYIMTGFHLKIV